MQEMEKVYDPKGIEEKWYAYWLEKKLFAATEKEVNPDFSVVIPPPNVTGSLHVGHALNNTLQDVLIRRKRMMGYNTLWMVGTDHAGIATQNVVEKQLAAKGLDRHELGRDRFVEEVWKWKRESGGTIVNQLKRLGVSCDWDRERFTMDEGLSRTVEEVFIRLYREGLIYRDDYIVNWCPRCHTAISDLEVEHREKQGFLYYLKYPLAGEKDTFVTVATTRPETMLGDTAVAVNPEDERYRHLIGRLVDLPFTGRSVPVIGDAYVDPAFGTGTLKITPAHDPNDFEIGRRHDLPLIKVMDDNASMNDRAGDYQGLSREACRKRIVEDFKADGLLDKIEDYASAVGECYRCHTVVEPSVSLQWFVRMKSLAEPALEAVRSGGIKFIPKNWEHTYFDWMENIRDWCISRQIWWGHRIPIWYCDTCAEITPGKDRPEACEHCGSTDLSPETDVLDTWFSSALWPFSTMGWPEENSLLERYYPTSVMVTGFDIIFFWVARMIMMGLKFRGEVPFKEVYIHALVRDEHGRKMSKSRGNVIDPLDIMERYGTDAVRFTLTALAGPGRDICLAHKRIEGYRNFMNKLWNAARFSLMNIEGYAEGNQTEDKKNLSLPDRWILSRVQNLVEQVDRCYDGYRFNEAAHALYQFFWHEYCDWYLEMAKPALSGQLGTEVRSRTQRVMVSVLKTAMQLLHPIIPFVTEEIWRKLPGCEKSIMVSDWPRIDTFLLDGWVEALMEQIQAIVYQVRNIRGEMNIPPRTPLKCLARVSDVALLEQFKQNVDLIKKLANLSELSLGGNVVFPEFSATAVIGDISIGIDLEGAINREEELARLDKELGKIRSNLAKSEKKLSSEKFLSGAPPAVVKKEKDRHQESRKKIISLEEAKKKLSAH
ncbi:MAG: valine--tRNA ligase [bacterium]